eukprot:CAMPEP_0183412588 /NCGR_PEP_ID=MMETSP0370-20130417/21122_1 /TAXON_ID=268820 /ORGANISM="Peridinium aciculiferum, Strain PAER-2" /LENGTH=228 /DNA_ID=CAMNT_0025595709 /DNA_START=7 /DNA_END=693 /DNA_ORIENTATION=+
MKMPVFAVYLGRDIDGEAEITFGGVRKERMASALTWMPVYEEGYWQFQISDVLINGKSINMCKKYGQRQCQGVLDTGSSLMMGPENDVALILKELSFERDTQISCTKDQKFPNLGFVIGGKTFEMEADDYMDRTTDGQQANMSCWAHLMPLHDTGRGPIFVLGMPFLRAFYTAYDVKNKKIGIAQANHKASPVHSADVVVEPLTALQPDMEDSANKAAPAVNNKTHVA